MSFKPGDSVVIEFTTQRFDTGAATNADSLPTGTAIKNGVDDGAVTVTVMGIDTGRYKAAFAVPLTYSAGDVVECSIAATVNSVAGKAIVFRTQLDSKRVGDLHDLAAGVAMALTSAYDAAKTASQFNSASDRVLIATQQIVFKKNAAFNGFEFVMTASTSHLPVTGLTVTAERALDGGALAACANSVTETTHGGYKINFAAGDLNGNSIRVRFSATGADDLNFTIVTQP